MSTSIKRKSLSVLLVLAMVISLFAGLGNTASAAVGVYDITFVSTNASVRDENEVVITTAQTDANGNLTFYPVPNPGGYTVTSVTLPIASTALITRNSLTKYTISNVEADTTVTVAATSGLWVDGGAYSATWYTNHLGQPSYELTSANELAGLSALVNGAVEGYRDGVTFSGIEITLGGVSPIDISGTAGELWYPIGDDVTPFAGTFDGAGLTISGLTVGNIVAAPAKSTYYGLFGYSNGAIKNVTINGEIDTGATALTYLGGAVGYTTNDVYNVHTNVAITAATAADNGASNVGGVVGAIENQSSVTITEPFKIQASSATGNIYANSRVGGVVGAVYCGFQDNVIVDNSFYSNGTGTPATLSISRGGGNSWSGGVVGYCQGEISDSYAVATLSTQGGHYVCGIAGILQGNAPQASLFNSYAAVSFGSGTNSSYDRPLYGSADNSNILPIEGVLYDSDLAGGFSNTVANGANGWGKWTLTGYASTTALKNYTGGQTDYVWTTQTPPAPPSQTTEYISGVLGGDFAQDLASPSTPLNTGYPVLGWQLPGGTYPTYVPGNGTPIGNDGTGIYIDGVNGNDNNSGTTIGSPVKTLEVAYKNAFSPPAPPLNIYVIDTITLTGAGIELDLYGGDFDGANIVRSITFGGYLFNVPTKILANVSGVTIDGNHSSAVATTATSSLFNVIGGNLILRTDAVLTDNYGAGSGGAVNVSSGFLVQTPGSSITNNFARRGGAVYVATGATFELNGGTITGNSAENVGGAVATRGSVVLTAATGTTAGGTIGGTAVGAGNTADYGGAVALMDAGTLTMFAGTITGNTANIYGNGVYLEIATNTFTITPTAGATFDLADTIYLSNGTYISIGATIANITGSLTVQAASPDEDVIVAQGLGYTLLQPDDIGKFSYSGGGWLFYLDNTNNQIKLTEAY